MEEDPASRKVRIWTRLQLLSKWYPKKYGDRVLNENVTMTHEEWLGTLK